MCNLYFPVLLRYLSAFKICAFLYGPTVCCVNSKPLSLCQYRNTVIEEVMAKLRKTGKSRRLKCKEELFWGQPNKMEAQSGGKVRFETFLDKPSSHCIGEYLWVHRVWSCLAGDVTMCMCLTPVLLWFLPSAPVSLTQGALSCLPLQCYIVSHTWPRNEDSALQSKPWRENNNRCKKDQIISGHDYLNVFCLYWPWLSYVKFCMCHRKLGAIFPPLRNPSAASHENSEKGWILSWFNKNVFLLFCVGVQFYTLLW